MERFSTNVPITSRVCWGFSTSCIIYAFVFPVINSKTFCWKDFTLAFLEAFLYDSYYNYKFSYIFSFINLLCSVENNNKNQIFSSIWLRKISLFFVYINSWCTSKAFPVQYAFILLTYYSSLYYSYMVDGMVPHKKL